MKRSAALALFGSIIVSTGLAAEAQADAPPENCQAALAAAGVAFEPVSQTSIAEHCQVQDPVQLSSLKTSLSTIHFPDRPLLNCPFALQFSNFVATQIQPLALQDMKTTLSAVGTGPGYDCRIRRGGTTVKLSEHATGNAVDISFLNFEPKSQVLVKDAPNEQAAGYILLRDMRAAACVAFTTVLGPGANAEHAEHFHVDLEKRKGGYRICE